MGWVEVVVEEEEEGVGGRAEEATAAPDAAAAAAVTPPRGNATSPVVPPDDVHVLSRTATQITAPKATLLSASIKRQWWLWAVATKISSKPQHSSASTSSMLLR